MTKTIPPGWKKYIKSKEGLPELMIVPKDNKYEVYIVNKRVGYTVVDYILKETFLSMERIFLKYSKKFKISFCCAEFKGKKL